jgi:hypothetical protein
MTRVETWMRPTWLFREWECCDLVWQLICVKGWWPGRWNWNPVCNKCGARYAP